MRKRWQVLTLAVDGSVIYTHLCWTRSGARRWIDRQGPPLRPVPTMPPMWSYEIARAT